MKANGDSGSRRFSARLKCTRPTRFQAGFSRFRKLCKSVFAEDRDAAIALPISVHSARKTSAVRYSAPGIIGPVNTSEASSPSVGAGTSGTTEDDDPPPIVAEERRHSEVTYRDANSRHQVNTGGRTFPISAAPSRTSPAPVPREKASTRRA